MRISEIRPAEVLFKQYCDAYQKRDLQAILNISTININIWGTGLDEHRIGLKQIALQLKRDWEQSEAGEIDIIQFVPTPAYALWTAATCKAIITIDGTKHEFPELRGTIVIAQEDNIWKIAHMHASFPDFRNADQNSFPKTAVEYA